MINKNGLVMMIDEKAYKVNILFNNTATENFGDKVMRLVKREVETALYSEKESDKAVMVDDDVITVRHDKRNSADC